MTTHPSIARLMTHRLLAPVLGAALLGLVPAASADAQWSTTYDQFYVQAQHNWEFRKRYATADRLFNAFDYGHAILYETLWTKPNASPDELEVKIYDRLTKHILVKPPRMPLEEAAIEPMYARLAPEAKMMFDWAHLLHRQLYDVLADERLDWAAKDREVARLVAYYRSRPDLAFSSRPKTMRLMQEQPYSLAFRKTYPKFNGLIWAYHWLQMGLYEPLMTATTVEGKQAAIRATVSRFFQMIADAPRTLPHQMPMTVPVAPAFAARYPEASIIFDNLHSMHDVVSDILANPSVPRGKKREEILRAARRFRDDTTEVMTVEAWKAMSLHMGAENMGGPAVGFLPQLPTPSVTYGAVMQHDATGAMTGFAYGGAIGGGHDAHAGHAGHAMPADPHAGHAAPAAATPSSDSAAVDTLITRFHTALAAGDSATALALLTPDVVVLDGGARTALAEFRSTQLAERITVARATTTERRPRSITVSGEQAFSVGTSVTTGRLRDREVNRQGAELIVARRTAEGWRIAAIHWSSGSR